MPDIDALRYPSMLAPHHQLKRLGIARISTSKGAMPPHRRQPGGPFGAQDAQGEIRSMLEQSQALDLATGGPMPATGAEMPMASGTLMPGSR
jgi:hypothetical protein